MVSGSDRPPRAITPSVATRSSILMAGIFEASRRARGTEQSACSKSAQQIDPCLPLSLNVELVQKTVTVVGAGLAPSNKSPC